MAWARTPPRGMRSASPPWERRTSWPPRSGCWIRGPKCWRWSRPRERFRRSWRELGAGAHRARPRAGGARGAAVRARRTGSGAAGARAAADAGHAAPAARRGTVHRPLRPAPSGGRFRPRPGTAGVAGRGGGGGLERRVAQAPPPAPGRAQILGAAPVGGPAGRGRRGARADRPGHGVRHREPSDHRAVPRASRPATGGAPRGGPARRRHRQRRDRAARGEARRGPGLRDRQRSRRPGCRAARCGAERHSAWALADPDALPGAPYAIVVANILLNTLVELAPSIARKVAPRGRLVLSGLLSSQATEAEAAYVAQRLLPAGRTERDGWVRVELSRGQR